MPENRHFWFPCGRRRLFQRQEEVLNCLYIIYTLCIKMFEFEDEFPNEEQFIKKYLNFLIESDDEDFESSSTPPIHYISYTETNSLYGTSSISSNVSETWSTSSSGLISSPREVPSKLFTCCVNPILPYTLWNDPDFGSNSTVSDFSFVEDFPKDQTSTPIKRSFNEYQPLHTDINVEDPSITMYMQRFSNIRPPPNRRIKLAPVSELNAMSQIKENVQEGSLELKYKSLGKTKKMKKSQSKLTDWETCIKENEMDVSTDLQSTVSDFSSSASTKKQGLDIGKENIFCKFCFKNGELDVVYNSHITKEADGTVVCPILRKYVCELCGETGDKAHTRKYCQYNTERVQRNPLYRRLSNGVLTTCHNHK